MLEPASDRAKSARNIDLMVRIARALATNDREKIEALAGQLDLKSAANLEALGHQHLLGLFEHAAPPLEMLKVACSGELQQTLDGRVAKEAEHLEMLLGLFDLITSRFQSRRIPCLLLKGFYLADRFYGDLRRRPQHDLDLLVPEADVPRAEKEVRALGFGRGRRDPHSITFERGRTQVDLHWRLRHAPAYDFDQRCLFDEKRSWVAAGRSFDTLSDEHTLVLLALSAFHDLERGACKIKQLLDLYLVVRSVRFDLDWVAFLRRRRAENLLGVWINLISLVTLLFDCADELPEIVAQIQAHQSQIALQSRAEALELLSRQKGAAESRIWFYAVYPGSLLGYQAWSLYQRMPGLFLRARPSWIRPGLRMVKGLFKSELRRAWRR